MLNLDVIVVDDSLLFDTLTSEAYSFLFVEVSVEEAFFGKRIPIELQGAEIKCPDCDGIGYRWHGKRPVCKECAGKGYKLLSWGKSNIRIVCKACGATGFSGHVKCKTCFGKGYIKRQREVFIKLPRGTLPGTILRVDGNSELGIGPAFIEIGIHFPETWSLSGLDIISQTELDLWDALLGGEVMVQTIDGKETLFIPPGTCDGHEFVLKGRGWIGRNGKRGDHRIQLKISMPKTPPPSQARILLKLLKGLWPVKGSAYLTCKSICKTFLPD